MGGEDLFLETPEQANELIDLAVEDIQGRGVAADGIVVESPQPLLGAAIANAAHGWRAELIVIGRRPRHPIGPILRRRVSDQIMRSATCPVLVVRSDSTI